ncbi:MAG TPA: hypothetical protein ENK18_12615 [Deltaproteobacteria bacterium]|nr:hypothetical protein [Deltaproteobacteria bacterium]
MVWFLGWCVPASPAARLLGEVEWSTVRLREHSEDVARSARLAVRDGVLPGFREDCSGFVSSVYTASGIDMDGRVATLWEAALDRGLLHHDPIPVIGDLAFFDNTWDRDGDGRFDDERTHIAVVVDVEPDGTIWMAHHGSKRAMIRMNLLDPRDEGSNSVLRLDPGGPLGLTRTGELWVGFLTVDPEQDWRTEG